MKALAIRYWLALALAIYFIGAVAPFVIVGAVVCSFEKPPLPVSDIASSLSKNVNHWTDLSWQKAFVSQLPANVSIVLLNSDQEVFRYGKPPVDTTPAGYTQVIVMDGAHQVGVANLYDVSFCGGEIYGTLALPASILVQIILGLSIAWVLGRYVLRPMSAMNLAAHKIASGTLEFQIPPSRVREVAEVATAFQTMGDALRGSLTRQAELEGDRRFFVGAIAHDLRTPLFSLRGYLEGLEKGLADTPEKISHYIAVCKDKADTLERLIADLFDYSRLEYLEQAPRRAPMDFSKLVDKCLGDIQMRARAKFITVVVDGPAEACPIEADWLLLSRALENLLDNALRYTPENGKISVSWSHTTDAIQFSVQDSGPGISAQDMPNLFTPLYRGETSRDDQNNGAGLGLAIAQRILRAHGGDLIATNPPGGGALFIGKFPINIASESVPQPKHPK